MNEYEKHDLTDEEILRIYDVLITKSWENADDNIAFQAAWLKLASAIGVKEVLNNGEGPVVRYKVKGASP